MEFAIGQRWISHSETQLGLGIVTEVANRRIKMLYPAVGESRIYAMSEAPLSRIRYNVGDTVNDASDRAYLVKDIVEKEGLITYLCTDSEGNEHEVHELDINSFAQFTTPQQRLFSGQLDKNKNFTLRVKTLQNLHRLQQSPVKGLLGSRTSLLPHQLYIANNIASRHAPRVLLADEVGLGKTIEAGMILHQQIYTGQAERVLILVPDSLIHQWLVELLRRFNLSFSIYDHERVESLLLEASTNPFEEEQKILCPLSLFMQNEVISEHVLNTHWDTVIVDEAHHLRWSPEEASTEYRFIESLSQHCDSLLLLTATPEQAGVNSHYARLRLLDPERFYSLESFLNEQKNYAQLNSLVQNILQETPLTEPQHAQLNNYLGEEATNDDQKKIVDKLLDRHGTGRVLFRNTRDTVQGFPQRNPISYPLPLSETYSINTSSLYPENGLQEEEWLQHDPRVQWLIDTLKSLKPEKVLVICHHAQTAISLDNYLNLRVGIRSASFYEDLSIIERDRAAAYFAEGSNLDEIEDGTGAQVLICSEIGSEGRNFQFAHHLILFDLPLNPDLLEQRIGRLDRIGQTEDISIHIPYLENTAQEVLYKWLHEGINLFSHSCAAAYEIYAHFEERLSKLLKDDQNNDRPALDVLIKETAEYTQQTLQDLHEGRDQLLELNSCNHEQAQKLIDQIHTQTCEEELTDYMELVFDQFGVVSDFHSEHSYVISPGDHMHGNFPGLREEGNTITYNRDKALRREDMEFVSWEHPMVAESMEMILNSEFGNTAVGVISVNGITKGKLFIEAWYSANIIAAKHLQLERYLPISPTRFLIDNNGKDYSNALSHDVINTSCNSLPKKTALSIVDKTRSVVQSLLEKTQLAANLKLKELLTSAHNELQANMSDEIKRLTALQKVNKTIRDDEIHYLENKLSLSKDHLDKTGFQLQAIRLLINN